MGDRCSRACNFCDVKTGGMESLIPTSPQTSPVRSPRSAWITSSRRASIATTSRIRARATSPRRSAKSRTVTRASSSKFSFRTSRGDERLVRKIIDAEPDVIAHNVETVERLQFPVRDRRAGYEQSLSVLEQVERESDIYARRPRSCSATAGTTTRSTRRWPTCARARRRHRHAGTVPAPVERPPRGPAVRPSPQYETWRRVAEDELGFLYCASGPMVRSSYKAGELFVDAVLREGGVAEARADARRSTPSAPSPER